MHIKIGLNQFLAPGIQQSIIGALQALYWRNENDHSVPTSGQKHAVAIYSETVGIAFLRPAWVPYRPFRPVPPKIVPPADDKKVQFQSLTLKWCRDIV